MGRQIMRLPRGGAPEPLAANAYLIGYTEPSRGRPSVHASAYRAAAPGSAFILKQPLTQKSLKRDLVLFFSRLLVGLCESYGRLIGLGSSLTRPPRRFLLIGVARAR